MNKIVVLFLIVFLGANARAQTIKLNVSLKDGSTIAFPIQEIQKITFLNIINTSIEDARKIKNVVKTFKLFQNYPNPFNPTTNIEYDLPKSGKVEIKIFNLNGQQIRHFVHGSQNAGIHRIVWDSKDEQGNLVASGVYLYQVKFEDSIINKKMMLIK